MAFLEWDESLALHIPAIDNQHKQLIGWIKTLHDAVQKGEGELIMDDVLQKLISYVQEHFSDEENLLLSHNFPGFMNHRQEHDAFVTKLMDMYADFEGGEEMSNKTLDFLIDWTINHIKGTDQIYGRFILDASGGCK